MLTGWCVWRWAVLNGFREATVSRRFTLSLCVLPAPCIFHDMMSKCSLLLSDYFCTRRLRNAVMVNTSNKDNADTTLSLTF